MKRLIRIVLLLLLSLLLLSAAAVFWLTGTNSGAQWALAFAKNQAGLDLAYGPVSGTLRSGLELERVEVKLDSAAISAERLSLAGHWDWSTSAVVLEEIDLSGLQVELLPADSPAAPEDVPFTLQLLASTVPVHFLAASVDDARLILPGEGGEYTLERIEWAGTWSDTLHLRQLMLIGARGELGLQGRVAFEQDGEIELGFSGSGRHAEIEEWINVGRTDRLNLEGELSGTLAALNLQLRSQAPELALSGTLANILESWSLEIILTASQLTIPIVDHPSGSLSDLSLRWALSADNPEQEISATGTVAMLAMSPVTVVADGVLQESALTLHKMVLNAPDVAAELGGTVNWADSLSGDLTLQWTRLGWPLNGEPLTLESDSGRLNIRGKQEDWAADGSMSLLAEAYPPGVFSFRAQGTEHSLQGSISEGVVLGGDLAGEVQADWSTDLSLQGNFTAQRLDASVLSPDWPERLNMQGLFDYSTAQDQQWSLQLASLSGLWRGNEFSGQGGLNQSGDSIVFQDFALQGGRSQLSLHGGLQSPEGLLLNIDAQRPDWLAGILGGNVQGQLKLASDWRNPAVMPLPELDLTLVDWEWDDWSVAKASLQRVEPEAEADWALMLNAEALTGPMGLLDTVATGLQQDGDQLQLSLAIGKGIEQLEAGLAGPRPVIEQPIAMPDWAGELIALRFQHGEQEVGSLSTPAPVTLSNGDVSLGDSCLTLRRNGALCLQADLPAAGGWSAQARLNAVPLALVDDWTTFEAQLTQAVSGTFDWQQNVGELPSGSAELTVSAGQLGERGDEDGYIKTGEGRLSFRMLAGNLTEGLLRLPLPGVGALDLTLGIEGVNLAGDGRLGGTVKVSIDDLALLESFTEGIDNIGGKAELDLSIAGSTANPELTGTVDILGAQLEIPELGIRIEELRGQGQVSADDRMLLDAEFRAGEGTGRLEGALVFADISELLFKGTLTGQRLKLLDRLDVRALASPNMNLQYAPGQLTLGGQVQIPEAWVSPTGTITGRVTESPDVVLLGESGDVVAAEQVNGNRIAGQLAVILGDDVRVETDQLDIKLSGAMNLRWVEAEVPVAEGQVFVNGKVEAWGPRLAVSDGRVRWSQSPADNPQLDIRAERDVFGNTSVRSAGVHISGPAQRPEVQSFTQPLTTQERAWSVLLTGSDVDYGQGVGALDVGTYIAPRIFLSYGISLFDSDNVVGIRYDLKKGWGVKATSGARDSGVDLSYTIEEGKKTDEP